jgi:hypothetical protein
MVHTNLVKIVLILVIKPIFLKILHCNSLSLSFKKWLGTGHEKVVAILFYAKMNERSHLDLVWQGFSPALAPGPLANVYCRLVGAV